MGVLTPTVIQKERGFVQDSVLGDTVNVVAYRIKATKVAQNDTIELDTQLGITTDKVIGMYGVVSPVASSDSAQETITIDDSDDELVLAGSVTGPIWIRIEVIE